VSLTEDQLRARFPNASEAFLRANGQLARPSPAPAPDRPPAAKEQPAKKRIRQSAKPLLNKLETEFRDYLRAMHPNFPVYEQAMTFRLGNGIRYTPDLCVMFEARLTCYEVKCPQRTRKDGKVVDAGKNVDRGKVVLKVAASKFPEIDWWLVWQTGAKWNFQKVLP
jgi:hypothetical protein